MPRYLTAGPACGELGLVRIEALPDRPTDAAIATAKRLIMRPPWVIQQDGGGIELQWRGDINAMLRINPDGTQGMSS